jgi:3'-5' exoribonuclease
MLNVFMTVQDLILQTPGEADAIEANFSCQVLQAKPGTTKNGKPFIELEISDGTASERFKVWNDANAYEDCEEFQSGDFIRIDARFRRNQFGLNVEGLRLRFLQKDEITSLLAGTPERQAKLQGDWDLITTQIAAFQDPRLRLLCAKLLEQYGEKFRRAAAARDYHHARRGGLLEHTAQMMRSAAALASVYPSIHWDLVKAGVLFHDCGKCWENDYQGDGFVSPYSNLGELLGHISIGIEVANRLWHSLADHPEFKVEGVPSGELVREHLLHLIASHHGEREYGAPVTPRTPEGWMLHYIDNMDARFEMLQQTYAEKPQVAPGIYDYRKPLEGHAVRPLPAFQAAL